MPVVRRFRVSRGRTLVRRVVRACVGSYVVLRGRTQLRAVVPFRAGSYLRAVLRYDRAGSGTTARVVLAGARGKSLGAVLCWIGGDDRDGAGACQVAR